MLLSVYSGALYAMEKKKASEPDGPWGFEAVRVGFVDQAAARYAIQARSRFCVSISTWLAIATFSGTWKSNIPTTQKSAPFAKA